MLDRHPPAKTVKQHLTEAQDFAVYLQNSHPPANRITSPEKLNSDLAKFSLVCIHERPVLTLTPTVLAPELPYEPFTPLPNVPTLAKTPEQKLS